VTTIFCLLIVAIFAEQQGKTGGQAKTEKEVEGGGKRIGNDISISMQ